MSRAETRRLSLNPSSRRVRRIYPSLIVVMACCLWLGCHILFSSELHQLATHVIASAFFVQNFALLRAVAERGLMPRGFDSAEAWIRERLAQHRDVEAARVVDIDEVPGLLTVAEDRRLGAI